MARKKKADEGGGGAPAWLVTYSDLVTLLLTFFVLLLSMANMDKMKFNDALGSLKGAFGLSGSVGKIDITKPKVISFAPMDDDFINRLYQKVNTALTRLRIDKDIDLVKDRGAVVLRVKESILFDSGSTLLKAEAHSILRKIAALVKPLPLNMRIEGHTDDLSSANPQSSNWDLSVQRAVSTLKFFASEKLIPLERMSAVGYGAQQPIVPNTSNEQRALNRRVEFVLESLGHYKKELPYLIDANDQLPF
ncbi:flagellar motor protein MotB [Syntrophotalea acetylenivorans]|uniref:Flagellar motor protein MotB n=1 Tax=Syntrophotalea acetylenivorans TaxID=1842532 RepID=A0A1L3GN64_9BACT|nr:flagellar motor protein MotB [Syntrophotalea acetylenivorans]APG27325.1 flagellar motor protein MotB [Syntrophotalea acetylenivorans]